MTAKSERGMVTAETAMVLPVLVALLLILVWVVSLCIAQVRLVDATREAARMSARGDSNAQAVKMAQKIAPDGTTVHIDDADGTARVRAELTVHPDLPLVGELSGVQLDSESTSVSESTEP